MNDWFEAEQRVERAQQLTELQQWVEALAEIDAALTINPHNAAWHAHRGYILDELDRVDEAAEAYERALGLEPGDRDVAIALGIALTRRGRLARALEVFENIAKTYPDFEPAYCHRIHIYAELGRHDQAEEMFYLAQELDDECPHCFFSIGVSLAVRGITDRAIYCWQRVLELDPDYVGVNRRIGQAYRSQGKLDRAREYLVLELRSDPGNTDLRYELAGLALEMGQVDTAAERFAQIVELDPGHLEAHFALGKIWLRQGLTKRALRCFEAVEGALEDEEHLPDFARWIGEALFRLERFDEACRRLKFAATQNDSDPDVLMLLGNSLLGARKHAEATDCFRKLLALDAHNPFAHHNLGVCLCQMGQHPAGLDHCLQAIRLKPDYLVAMYNATIGHIQLGRWREARAMLRRALRHDPQNEALQHLSKRLWRYRLQYYLTRALAVLRLVPGSPADKQPRLT